MDVSLGSVLREHIALFYGLKTGDEGSPLLSSAVLVVQDTLLTRRCGCFGIGSLSFLPNTCGS